MTKRVTRLYLIILCIAVTSQAWGQAQYWHNLKRELRYTPEGEDFVIVNGHQKFTRALYGTNTAFRLETSDVPEFGFFSPNMGGNLQLGIIKGQQSLWLNQAEYIKSIYRAGARIYQIKDPILGKGTLEISVLAMARAEGMIMQVSGTNLPPGTAILYQFGGATNQRFHRNGDLGVDDPDCFALKPEACLNNAYTLHKNTFELEYGKGSKSIRHTLGIFPKGSQLKTGAPDSTASPETVWASTPIEGKPVLLAKSPLKNTQNQYVSIRNQDALKLSYKDLPQAFAQAETRRREIAGTLRIHTPDAFINPVGSALSMAADGIWEHCWLHGAVGWRIPLNGWRAAYTGDCLGWHQRSREHFDGYAASQIKNLEPTIAHPAQDTGLNLARAAKIWGTPMYSKGYICRKPNDTSRMHHYDMNLCYIDELLWHLNWTGDLDYARKMWPVLQRHLQWEKRNFDPDHNGLYDAYASIWASDALYYNSGSVTHSSAYNYRANQMAASIAAKIGEDAAPYEQAATQIRQAIDHTLWMPGKGVWAEFKDFMGLQNLHTSPALWTIYHALDSDIATPFQAYQATRYVDTEIPHIPIRAKGLQDDGYYMLSTSNWMPYAWSINNVATAEVAHTCLAYWQAGRNNEAFKLFKSLILDGMYLGSSPGNIGQISFYDAARGECYRDFGDPVGVMSRALVQGLFGIRPHVLENNIVIRPGFPSEWNEASMATTDIEYQFRREGTTDHYTLKNHLAPQATLTLLVKAQQDHIASVAINGSKATWSLEENVGYPLVKITCPAAETLNISIQWKGKPLEMPTYQPLGVKGEPWQLTASNNLLAIKDPQEIIPQAQVAPNKVQAKLGNHLGHHTFFVQLQQGSMTWWQPIDLEIKEPVSILAYPEASSLQFTLHNNRKTSLRGLVTVNPGKHAFSQTIDLLPHATSEVIQVPQSASVTGTNRVKIAINDTVQVDTLLINWNIATPNLHFETVDMSPYFNHSVANLFTEKYLTPRSPYTTLQIPVHGIGEWCHPKHTAHISDTGFRQVLQDNLLLTPWGAPFQSVSTLGKNNIAFTSLWDNFPDSIEIPLSGKAAHAYLLMAGSTNPMQCHRVNGTVTVRYQDGSTEVLELINPDNWLPIEQDLYLDGQAFRNQQPRPYRVAFKNGMVSRNMEKVMHIDPNEVYGRTIENGAGTILDLPLNEEKTLQSVTLKTTANEVVIGLMGITLGRERNNDE